MCGHVGGAPESHCAEQNDKACGNQKRYHAGWLNLCFNTVILFSKPESFCLADSASLTPWSNFASASSRSISGRSNQARTSSSSASCCCNVGSFLLGINHSCSYYCMRCSDCQRFAKFYIMYITDESAGFT